MYWKKGLLTGFILSIAFVIVWEGPGFNEKNALLNPVMYSSRIFVFWLMIGIPAIVVGLIIGILIDRKRAGIYGNVRTKVPYWVKGCSIAASIPILAWFIFALITELNNGWLQFGEGGGGVILFYVLPIIEVVVTVAGGIVGGIYGVIKNQKAGQVSQNNLE